MALAAKKEQPPAFIEPREDLMRAARQAAVRIAERAPEADRQRRVPVENIQDLHEAGLLTVAIPRDLGGTEADLVTQVAIYEIIGGACASTAWVMGNHSVLCTRALGMMGEAAHPLLQDVVQNGALISHAAIPGGKTELAPGGFVASGRWPFVSGSNISTWMFLSTMVPGSPPAWNGAESPQAHNRWMLLPTSQPGLTIEETWLAMSVRGSMTNDVLLDQVFVAEDMAPVSNRPAPHEPWMPNGPAVLKVPTKARVWMAGMMLGIAQAALDETVEYGKARGMALGKRLRGHGGRVFVLLGAGELQEGQIYESLLTAANQGMQGVTVIVDCNGIQSDRGTEVISPLGNMRQRFEAFGWHVNEIDGHDHDALAAALGGEQSDGQPQDRPSPVHGESTQLRSR